MTAKPQSTATHTPTVLLSAFSDEAANSKSVVEQFAVLAALGLRYYSPRFLNVSGAVKHVMALDPFEIETVLGLQRDYGLSVASIGSPIGKVKLFDFEDGTRNRYVSFDKYLSGDVATAIERAVQFDTRLVRGFSFYHPAGKSPDQYLDQAADGIAAIAEKLAAAGLVYGLEVEANLVGQSGRLLAELAKRVAAPNLVCIYDGGNLACQNMSSDVCLAEFQHMAAVFGWMHIKDYAIDQELSWTGSVDEERLRNFVPCDIGDTGHVRIFQELRKNLAAADERMKKLGAPGVFLELEPHLKGGGQFGGFSGPDGLGVACRALCKSLDFAQIPYELRTMEHIRAARGF